MRKNTILYSVVVLLITTGFLSACNYSPSLETVPAVDLEKYTGKWYEIASIPQRFAVGCHCTTAEYKLNPEGYMDVINSCRKDSATGRIEEAEGKAYPVTGSNNSKLAVQFQWPFEGDYWILELAKDYSHAVVGSPDRESLWILSRTPSMDEATYKALVEKARTKGFPVEALQPMDQSCNL